MIHSPLGLALLVVPLSFAACATNPIEKENDNQAALAQEVRDEETVGRAMAAKLAGNFGVYAGDGATELQRYVALIGKTVAARASRPEIHFHFGVLKSEEINAFATPGGYIFVTTGLLRATQDENELAGILGHEIAHITERHLSKEILPKRDVSAGETLTRLLSRGGSDLAFSFSRIVNQGLETLLVRGMGAEREHEADTAGVTYSTAAGYQSSALERFLARLHAKSGELKIAATHPPLPRRLTDLRSFLNTNGFTGEPALKRPSPLQTRFQQATRFLREKRS